MDRQQQFLLPGEPLVYFRCAVPVALLATLLSCPKLWVSDGRVFPTIAFADGLPKLPVAFEGLLFLGMLICLVAVFLGKRMKFFACAFTLTTAALCFFDQNRLQPWLYEYTFLLLAAVFVPEEGNDADDRALNACRLVLISVYFWAALQKLNYWFGAVIIPWLFQPILPELRGEAAVWVGCSMAAFELSTAVMLLFKRTRNLGVTMAIVLHVTVLMLLMHWRWNKVVWPWNISMIVFIVLLFLGQSQSAKNILLPRTVLHGLALLLFAAMPALNFAGKWDYYLSSALYSGNVPVGRLEMSEESFQLLPPQVRKAAQLAVEKHTLRFEDWIYDELGVPPYPEVRVLKRVGDFAARQLLSGEPCVIRIITYPHSYSNIITIETTRYGSPESTVEPVAGKETGNPTFPRR